MTLTVETNLVHPKNIYLLCPVRGASKRDKKALEKHVALLEREGHTVFYPTRDNPYEDIDPLGTQITNHNSAAIQIAHEVHIFWRRSSRGSLVDLGLAYAYHKPIVIISMKTPEGPCYETLMENWPWGVEDMR